MPQFNNIADLDLYEYKNELNEIGRPWTTWRDKNDRLFVVMDRDLDLDGNVTMVRLYNVHTSEMNWLPIADLKDFKEKGALTRVSYMDRKSMKPIKS